jgi:hypothetical protein
VGRRTSLLAKAVAGVVMAGPPAEAAHWGMPRTDQE